MKDKDSTSAFLPDNVSFPHFNIDIIFRYVFYMYIYMYYIYNCSFITFQFHISLKSVIISDVAFCHHYLFGVSLKLIADFAPHSVANFNFLPP